jgi:hypothetical protein
LAIDNLSPTVVLMAAGHGSRYGGAKQLDNIGPSGETLLDYAVYDARRAGFTRFVFVTRADLMSEMSNRARSFPKDVSVTCIVQEEPNRTRPWGTVHAVLVAEASGDGPVVALNADDFYGLRAYELAAHACRRTAATGAATVIGMPLEQTLSEHGAVVRAICETNDGWLTVLDEVHDLARNGGEIEGRTRTGEPRTFSGREIVSMNLWILPQPLVGHLAESLATFKDAHGDDPEAELPLPEAIGALIASGEARVRVMESPGPWFGLTHSRDRAAVVTGLQSLVDRGLYPRTLWQPQSGW